MKPIQKGMSGGVTKLGLMAAVLGGLIVSVLALPRFGILGMSVVIALSFFCSILDSIFGAAFQAKYQLRGEYIDFGQLTERTQLNGESLRLVQGISWVNNDLVNFVGVLICGLLLTIIW